MPWLDEPHDQDHAARHSAGGADEVDAADLSSGAATDGQVLTADGAGAAAWEDPTGGGGAGGAAYAETIGDGVATSYQVTHSLGSQDLVVQLWDLTGAEPVEATGDASQIEIDDDDNITVTFGSAPATDSYRVVILASGGSAGGGGGDTLIEEIALASNASAVTFSSIPQIYSELRLEWVGRSTRAGSPQDETRMRFGNGTLDTGSNYSFYSEDITGGISAGDAATSFSLDRFSIPGATAPANLFAPHTTIIPQYANTSIRKTFHSQGGLRTTGNNRKGESVGDWASTSALDIISLFPVNGDWVAGSVFRLYGVG